MDIQLTEEQQKTVLKNTRLVHYIVRKIGVSNSDYDDIVSIGTIGLIKAVATFDVSKNFKFATYATMCIKNEIFMSFRKSNKDHEVLSFEETLNNMDDKEITLKDMISDPKSLDFEKQSEDAEVIAKALSYVLNCLSRKIAIILLFSMAGINQIIIGDMLEMSQSYVSRIVKKNSCKLKKNYEEINNKEVFTVALKDDKFEIKFSTADVTRFNRIFANFLLGINDVENLQHFKVNCAGKQVVIHLPAEPESFAFIACIIKEIENFSMSFDGASQISSEDDEKEYKEANIEEENEGGEVAGTTNTEIADLEEELQMKSSIPDLQPEIQNVNGNTSTAEKTSNTEASTITTAISNSSISKQVREYILSKDEFFVKEVNEKFPHIKAIISNVINTIKNKGLIFSDYRGHYIVKK